MRLIITLLFALIAGCGQACNLSTPTKKSKPNNFSSKISPTMNTRSGIERSSVSEQDAMSGGDYLC